MKKVKKFIRDNQDDTIIILISLIAFILGCFAKRTGEVTIESIIKVIKETFPGKIGEKNATACKIAYDLA